MIEDQRDTYPPETPRAQPAEQARLAALWQASRVIVGVLLVALGALGCVLPIVPGVPLILAGAALLGPRHWLVRPFADRLQRWRQRRAARPPFNP